MKNFDVCILGSGASGSLCAIELAKNGFSVCVVDANDFPAKKLLVTGNGRCNLTNKNMSSDFYNQNIDKYVDKFTSSDTLKLFNSFGLETYFDEEGRCYPISNSAKSVCFVIKNQFDKYRINFFGNQKVVNISKTCDTYIIETEQNTFNASYLVFATGHNIDMLEITKKMGESTKNFIPSLVALKTKENTKKISGERLSNVKVWTNFENKTFEQNGEVLFKDNGISGICIFNLSSIFAEHGFSGKLYIDLLPALSINQIKSILMKKAKIFDNVGNFMQGVFSKQICFEILKRVNLSLDVQTKKITDIQIDKIAYTIKNFEFNICGHYDNNQVCLGGVELDSLTQNLQSKINKNLYFCGEICDVSGVCGGYNLQWAFTSASLVAEDIIKNKS